MKMYNGGIKITFKTGQTSTYDLNVISSYDVSWENEFDTDEAGNMVYLSRTANLSVTTGALTESECNELLAILKSNTGKVTMTAPQVGTNAEVSITSIGAPLEVSNFFGKYYRLSFSAQWRDNTITPVSIGSITPIASYSGNYQAEVETFEAYDFHTVEIWKGKRFSCSFTTGKVDKSTLYNNTNGWVNKVLANRWVNLTVPDGTFNFAVDNVSTNLEEGDKYTMSASLTAIDLIPYDPQVRPT